MKLLLDHNLSPRLVQRLSDLYPDVSHVALVSLDRASDLQVCEYARTHGYVIVTKDSDFNDFTVLCGYPPKVVWLRLGNCTTGDVERALKNAFQPIVTFAAEPDLGVLEVSGPANHHRGRA